MTPVRTRLAGALLALALVPLPSALAAPAAAAEPAAPSLGHSVSASALTPVGARAAQVRSTLAAGFQAHTALAAITENAYLTKGDRLGRAAASVASAQRYELAASVAGGTTAAAAAFREALAAHDTAKLA